MSEERKDVVKDLDEVDEIIDIEAFAKKDKKPVHAKKYRIKVDKEYFVVGVETMTGREILILASKTPPENFMLHQKYKGGKTKKIELSDVVDFMEPGVEKFQTLPLDATEG